MHPSQITLSGATRQQELYENAINLLKMCEPPEGYYVATSFGKDSIVAHLLCKEAGVKFDAHTNVTGIDPPELIYFGREHYPEVIRERPDYTMWQLIARKGFPPMRNIRYCCEHLKEDKGHGRTCVMGIRAEESSRRKKNWAPLASFEGNSADKLRLFDAEDIQQTVQSCAIRSKWVVNPLYYWTITDLWDFIHDRKLPYCCLYDEGFDRLGCIACPYATEQSRRMELERWPGFRKLYVRSFDGLIENGRFTNKGFLTGEEVLEWWLSKPIARREIEGQMSLSDFIADGE